MCCAFPVVLGCCACPPPPSLPQGAVTWVVCPPGPPVYVDSCSAARVSGPGGPQGNEALSAPWGPSNRPPRRRGRQLQPRAAPPVPAQSGSADRPQSCEEHGQPLPLAVVGSQRHVSRPAGGVSRPATTPVGSASGSPSLPGGAWRNQATHYPMRTHSPPHTPPHAQRPGHAGTVPGLVSHGARETSRTSGSRHGIPCVSRPDHPPLGAAHQLGNMVQGHQNVRPPTTSNSATRKAADHGLIAAAHASGIDTCDIPYASPLPCACPCPSVCPYCPTPVSLSPCFTL